MPLHGPRPNVGLTRAYLGCITILWSLLDLLQEEPGTVVPTGSLEDDPAVGSLGSERCSDADRIARSITSTFLHVPIAPSVNGDRPG